MDFSTKKNTEIIQKPSYTSTKELRFAKNLKLLLVEIMRKHPVKAKIILNYLRFAWNKSSNNSKTVTKQEVKVQQAAATSGQPQSFVQVSDGQGGSGSSTSGSGSASGSNQGSSSSGGGGGASGGGGGGHHYGGSGGLGGGCSGGSSGGNGNDGDGNGNHRRNINNNNKGSILDMELDFEELPQAANSNTAKWFQEHQDINAGKILDGLLGLKTEFPDDNSNGSNPGSSSSGGSMDKPPDMASLDHATANLLQMSVPDPSTTFLDIGTDVGGASLYEDDPFNLEHLLPSNFNINQLDLLPSSPDHHLQHNNNQHILNAHGAETSMTITPKTLMENNNTSHNLSLHPQGGPSSNMPHHLGGHHSQASLPSAIGMSLYPETTISPMAGPPGSHQMHPMSLKNVIKQEPVAYIKREDNNNAPHLMQLHAPNPHHPHQLLNDGYSLHNPGMSPISPVTSAGSPGSPPHHSSSKADVMAMVRIPGGPSPSGHMLPQGPPPGLLGSSGGGKMPSSSRKKSTSTGNPEEDELASIPSLQMRIKILQQRVSEK